MDDGEGSCGRSSWTGTDNSEIPTRPCSGGLGVCQEDMDFLVEGASDFPWMYIDGRGCFCRDCHNLWRILYTGRLTLTLFGKWLKGNGLAFYGKLVANWSHTCR